jgi:predicted MFS family arabinose efflux permease
MVRRNEKSGETAMRAGFVFLVLAYVLSQFFRAFLAVLTPVLGADLGATASDLSLASGLWFAAFAAMQIPVGIWLDRIGPRRTAGTILLIGGAGGAALFALAQTPGMIVAAMVLIGVGCSPVLMASFYIFAHSFSPRVFASLAGALIGVGSAGNLASAAPTAWAVEAFGWRETMAGLAVASLIVGLGLLATIRDPARAYDEADRGRLADLLRIPALWVIVPMLVFNYAPAAGIRGLWAGPYLGDVFDLDTTGIGVVTLWMALAMILGNFAYGPLDRMLGTRKWVVLVGNVSAGVCLIALGIAPGGGIWQAGLLLAAVGFFGASFPMVMAHARSFYPAGLIGRGVTLANLLSIGGVGMMQIVSGRVHGAVMAVGAGPEAAYGALFLMFGVLLLASCAVYLFAEDRLD